MRIHSGKATPARAPVLVLSLACACATLNNPAVHDLDRQNQSALNDYQQGQAKAAQTKLIAAIDYAEKQGIAEHGSAARSQLYLGIVYAGGLKQPERAVEHMTVALEQSPHLTVPSNLNRPPVARAYQRANKLASKTVAKRQKKEAVVEERSLAQAAAEAEKARKAEEAAARDAGEQRRKDEAATREAAAREKAENEAAERNKPVAAKPGRRERTPPKQKEKATPDTAPAVAASEPPPVVAPPPEEVDVPAPLDKDIVCPLPYTIPTGKELVIWCAIKPALRAQSVTLQVRPANQTEFFPMGTERSKKGWFVATVDGALVQGSMLQYYVEAVNAGGKVVASTGSFTSPELVMIRDNAPAVDPLMTADRLSGKTTGAAVAASDNEDPFAPEQPPAMAKEDTGKGFDVSHIFFSLGLGTGWGWHAAANPEFRPEQDVPSGTALASLMHLLPEVGYQLNDDLGVSLQLRYQLITEEGTRGRNGQPARGAFSALARAQWRIFHQDEVDVLATGVLGGGEGYRLVLSPKASESRGGTDTIRRGPVVAGPGAAMLYHLTPSLGLLIELRALVGFPDFGVLGEANAAIRYDL